MDAVFIGAIVVFVLLGYALVLACAKLEGAQ